MTGPAPEKHLYLVDGTSQLFRAYYAIRGLSNAEGLPTGAVYGFTTMLRKLLQDEAPPYIAVAFDLPGPTFRHDRYAGYKADRPPVPEDLNVQAPFAREVCRALRIETLELAGYEADDLIATYARLAREAGFRVTVVASDKDLLQLVGEGVSVLNPSKDVRLDAEEVARSFGVPPDRVRDVLGLMGDSVDNIPGVPGVGEKTALAMIGLYGPLEEVLARARLFVEALELRDALLGAMDGLEEGAALSEDAASGLRERAQATERGLRALLTKEKDPELLRRLALALDALVGAGLGEATAGDATKTVTRRARDARRALSDLDRGTGKRAWVAVRDHADQALMSRQLATLDHSVPIRFIPEALVLEPPDTEACRALYRSLGFRGLLAELPETADTGAVFTPAGGCLRHETILDLGALERAAAAIRQSGRLALTTVAEGEGPIPELLGLSLAHEPSGAFYIPLRHDSLSVPAQIGLEDLRAALAPLLTDPAVKKLGHDVKREIHILHRFGLEARVWDLDTTVAAFLLDPGRTGYRLDRLAEEFLGWTIRDLVSTGGERDQNSLRRADVENVAAASAEGICARLRLAELLSARLEEAGIAKLYRGIDGPLLPILAGMEETGVRIDAGVLGAMSGEMERSLEIARRRIQDLAGTPLNPDSPKQLREVLFGKLGLKPGRKTAKGRVDSTDAATLEELAGEHEIAREILAYRELAKLKGTYVDALPLLVRPETGRVHTTYDPTGAATGRLSSSDPNLQNIPARTEAGLRIRSAFVPDPGHLFLASDYSQVELRVLAHLTRDPELVAAFRAGEDIHRRTASRIFGVMPELVTDTMRRRAKAVNFGILYGMSETRLARDQGIARSDARRFIEAYFERFREVRAYIERVRAQAVQEGEVKTLFGRVRRFPQLKGRSSRPEVEQALRAAVNTTIQGTAADLMKMAMLRVDGALREHGLRTQMLLQVHDELLFEVPESEVEEAGHWIREAMEQVHPLAVPLAVDQKVGRSWMDVT